MTAKSDLPEVAYEMKITRTQLRRIIREASHWYSDEHETLADKKFADSQYDSDLEDDWDHIGNATERMEYLDKSAFQDLGAEKLETLQYNLRSLRDEGLLKTDQAKSEVDRILQYIDDELFYR